MSVACCRIPSDLAHAAGVRRAVSSAGRSSDRRGCACCERAAGRALELDIHRHLRPARFAFDDTFRLARLREERKLGAKELAQSFRTVRKNTIQVAEDIPEAQYSFVPADGTRTVAQTLVHVGTMTALWQEIRPMLDGLLPAR